MFLKDKRSEQMTCIVGLRTPNGVYIGGDSAGKSENYVAIRADRKVFALGDFVFGFTTSFRMGQLIQYKFNPPTPPENQDELFGYMVSSFVDGIREVFADNGYMHTDKDGEEFGGVFMVGYKDRMFVVYSDFQVEELVVNYSAIGCGQEYAFGSLYSTSHLDAEERIINALSAAEFYSPGVCAPFYIVTTIK